MPPFKYHGQPRQSPALSAIGRAWRKYPDRNTQGRASWVVFHPQSHPFFSWYLVGVTHLRPEEGLDEPFIQYPGATHEFACATLNPEEPLPTLGPASDAHMLSPIDFVVQTILPSDEAAIELLEQIVRHAVVEGVPLDSDFKVFWAETIHKSAEHVRLEGHPDAH